MSAQVGEAVAFEAVAYNAAKNRPVSMAQWAIDFGDGATSDENPTSHAYSASGTYTVTIIASSREGTGSAATTVTVSGGLIGVCEAPTGPTLGVRFPGSAPLGGSEVCDMVEIFCDMTGIACMGAPILHKTRADGTTMDFTMARDTSTPPEQVVYEWAWMTFGDADGATFTATYMLFVPRAGWPPFSIQMMTIGPATWAVHNTSVSCDGADFLFTGDPVTLEYTLDHCDLVYPTFTVTIGIYGIEQDMHTDTPLLTISEGGKGLGSNETVWDGDLGMQPPPGMDPPQASVGVYKFRVSAQHTTMPMCQDTGLVMGLEADVTGPIVGETDPSAGTLTGRARYTLNKRVMWAHLDVYGPLVGGGYGLLIGNVGCPNLDEGSWLSDEFTVPVGFDENGNVIGPITDILVPGPPDDGGGGGGGGDDGKPSDPPGGVGLYDFTVNITIATVSEADEMDPGGFVWFNRDFDAGGFSPDYESVDPCGTENDLQMLMISAHADPAVTSRTVSLTWNNADKIRVWEGFGKQNEVSQAAGFSLAIPAGQESYGKPFWIEGIDPSASVGDTTFTLTHYGLIGGENILARDRARGTTWDAKLQSIGFTDGGPGNGGNNEHELYESSPAAVAGGWGVGALIADPVWEANPNGPDAPPIKNLPVCYTMSRDTDGDGIVDEPSRLCAELSMDVKPPGLAFDVVGNSGQECFRAEYQVAGAGPTDVTLSPNAAFALPDHIARTHMAFDWRISPNNPAAPNALDLGGSDHEVYVIWGVPLSTYDSKANQPTLQRLNFVISGETPSNELEVAGVSGLSTPAAIADMAADLVMGMTDENRGGTMDFDPRWLLYSQADRRIDCWHRAALACDALGVIGMWAAQYTVFATSDDPGVPVEEVTDWRDVNRYVAPEPASLVCRRSVDGQEQDLRFYGNNGEGAFIVRDGSLDDGYHWCTVWPRYSGSRAKDVLQWYGTESLAQPQGWYVWTAADHSILAQEWPAPFDLLPDLVDPLDHGNSH